MCKIEEPLTLKKKESASTWQNLESFLEKYIKCVYWLLSVVSVWSGILLIFTNASGVDIYLEVLDNYKLENYENNVKKLENFYKIKSIFQVTIVIVKIAVLLQKINW